MESVSQSDILTIYNKDGSKINSKIQKTIISCLIDNGFKNVNDLYLVAPRNFMCKNIELGQ